MTRRTNPMPPTAAALTLAALASCGSTPPARPDANPAAAAPVERWAAAVRAGDSRQVAGCLAAHVREAPEYASAEAMDFWRSQLDELEREGFRGAWHVVRDEPASDRATVLPVLEDGPASEGIEVVREAGAWRIARLF